jgi:hypothetical protein
MNMTGKVDLNTFVDQAAKLAKSLDAGTSLLYNNSGKKANFYCYNGGDFVMAVPYSKPAIAAGCSGLIAAGGTVFKVFADNKGDAEFLVKPNRAYVYGGPGNVREL